MAMTAEQWEARKEVLERMLSSGVLSTKHGDTQLTYRSMDDLMRAISYADSQIKRLNGTSGRRPNYVLQPSKG